MKASVSHVPVTEQVCHGNGRTANVGYVRVQASAAQRGQTHALTLLRRAQLQARTANVIQVHAREPPAGGDHPEGAASDARGCLAREKKKDWCATTVRASRNRRSACHILMCLNLPDASLGGYRIPSVAASNVVASGPQADPC
jgi:hypothetical protein